MVKERGFQPQWFQPLLLLCVHLHPTAAKLVLLFSHGACGSSWGDMDDVTFAHLVSDYLSFRILWSRCSPSTGFPLPEHVPTCFYPPYFFFHFFIKTISTHSLANKKSWPEMGFPWRSPSITCLVLPQPSGRGLNWVLVWSCIFAHLQNKISKWKSADSASCFLHFPPCGLHWLPGAWDMAKVMLNRNLLCLA